MTSWPLTFSDRFDYSQFNNIRFPLTLSTEVDKQILIRPSLDAGSTLCIFQRSYANLLGLENGRSALIAIPRAFTAGV